MKLKSPNSYAESIELLYSSNVFDISSFEGIFFLSTTILPQRMNAIKSLQLFYSIDYLWKEIGKGRPELPPENKALWEANWRIVAGMNSLKRLDVFIMLSSEETTRKQQAYKS
jgi:hypothetical protein